MRTIILVTKETRNDTDAPGTDDLRRIARRRADRIIRMSRNSFMAASMYYKPSEKRALTRQLPFAMVYDGPDMTYVANTVRPPTIAEAVYAMVATRLPPSKSRKKMVVLVTGSVSTYVREFRRLLQAMRETKRAQVAVAHMTTRDAPSALRRAIHTARGQAFVVLLDLRQRPTLNEYVPTLEGIYYDPVDLGALKYHYKSSRL